MIDELFPTVVITLFIEVSFNYLTLSCIQRRYTHTKNFFTDLELRISASFELTSDNTDYLTGIGVVHGLVIKTNSKVVNLMV